MHVHEKKRRHQLANVGLNHNRSQSSQVKIASHNSLWPQVSVRQRDSKTFADCYSEIIFRIPLVMVKNNGTIVCYVSLCYTLCSCSCRFLCNLEKAVPPTRNPALLFLYWKPEGQHIGTFRVSNIFFTSIWAGFGAGSGPCLRQETLYGFCISIGKLYQLGLCFGLWPRLWFEVWLE